MYKLRKREYPAVLCSSYLQIGAGRILDRGHQLDSYKIPGQSGGTRSDSPPATQYIGPSRRGESVSPWFG